jgi:hypothetical protein
LTKSSIRGEFVALYSDVFSFYLNEQPWRMITIKMLLIEGADAHKVLSRDGKTDQINHRFGVQIC